MNISEDNPLNRTDITVGKKVKIKKVTIGSLDNEDYYYLKKFELKTGTIVARNKCRSGDFAYRIEFDNEKSGYFYRDDFE